MGHREPEVMPDGNSAAERAYQAAYREDTRDWLQEATDEIAEIMLRDRAWGLPNWDADSHLHMGEFLVDHYYADRPKQLIDDIHNNSRTENEAQWLPALKDYIYAIGEKPMSIVEAYAHQLRAEEEEMARRYGE